MPDEKSANEPELVTWPEGGNPVDVATEMIERLNACRRMLFKHLNGCDMLVGIEMYRTSEKMPPKGVPVIVSGGVAKLKTGGEWYSGMDEPLFQHPLKWTPKWWMRIPEGNK